MELFGKTIKIQKGRVDKQTQQVAAWRDAGVEYTSAFVTNIQNKIASEISKVNFNHVKYKVNDGGVDTLESMQGSDIDEVLNWQPKGYENSSAFWSKVVKLMMQKRVVQLQPHYKNDAQDIPRLSDLTILDDSSTMSYAESVNLVSPFFLNDDTSILDTALSSISTKLTQGKLRALYRVNATIDETAEDFKNRANLTIRSIQESSQYNGIGAMDAKGEIIELKNGYSVLNEEEIALIKSELLSAYFMNEKILLGTASQEEQIAFYNATIIPLLFQLEKELSYKLIPNSRRRKKQGNLYYERIVIDNQLFKFASLKDLIALYHENINAPIFTVNEFKVMIGEQPVEGGDVYLTNLNSKVITSFEDLKKKALKLINNTAKIVVNELEDGKKTFSAVAAYVDIINKNGYQLAGDVVKMEREVYPFLFNHGSSAQDVIGDVKTHYDSELNAYVSEINMYDTNPAITKALENGAYDSVSISYYVNEYTFGDEDQLVIHNATMNEVSLVSVGADPNAKIFSNGMSDELNNAIEEHKAEKQKAAKIKEIKDRNELD